MTFALKDRLRSGLSICAAMFAIAIWAPPAGVLVVLLVVCFVGTREFYHLLDEAGILHFKVSGTIGGLLLILGTWVSMKYRTVGDSYEWEGVVLFGVLAFLLVRLVPQKDNPRPLETIGATLLGIMYVPFLFNFFTKLLLAWDGGEARRLVLYMIVVVKATDMGAFFIGCSVGRHKMMPRISPAKTWEGCIGGIATGLLASWLFYAFCRGDLRVVTLAARDAVRLGLLLPLSGTIGDLVESLMKRAAGVKDSGHFAVGMGGLLDVIDSLLVAAPVLYVYARFFLEKVTALP